MIYRNIKKINSSILPLFYKFKFEYCKINPFKKVSYDKVLENFTDDRDYIHEYQVRETAKNIYSDIHESIYTKKDFFMKNYLSPKLSYILNEVSKNIDPKHYIKDIEFNKVEIIDIYKSYGFVSSNNKLFGLFNKEEIIHELSVGMIGPEISSIWDQRPIKQILIISIDSEKDKSVMTLERDLMLTDKKWILSDINYF